MCGDGRGGRVRVEGRESDSWMVVDLGKDVALYCTGPYYREIHVLP